MSLLLLVETFRTFSSRIADLTNLRDYETMRSSIFDRSKKDLLQRNQKLVCEINFLQSEKRALKKKVADLLKERLRFLVNADLIDHATQTSFVFTPSTPTQLDDNFQPPPAPLLKKHSIISREQLVDYEYLDFLGQGKEDEMPTTKAFSQPLSHENSSHISRRTESKRGQVFEHSGGYLSPAQRNVSSILKQRILSPPSSSDAKVGWVEYSSSRELHNSSSGSSSTLTATVSPIAASSPVQRQDFSPDLRLSPRSSSAGLAVTSPLQLPCERECPPQLQLERGIAPTLEESLTANATSQSARRITSCTIRQKSSSGSGSGRRSHGGTRVAAVADRLDTPARPPQRSKARVAAASTATNSSAAQTPHVRPSAPTSAPTSELARDPASAPAPVPAPAYNPAQTLATSSGSAQSGSVFTPALHSPAPTPEVPTLLTSFVAVSTYGFAGGTRALAHTSARVQPSTSTSTSSRTHSVAPPLTRQPTKANADPARFGDSASHNGGIDASLGSKEGAREGEGEGEGKREEDGELQNNSGRQPRCIRKPVSYREPSLKVRMRRGFQFMKYK